jgi:hypothetical protein
MQTVLSVIRVKEFRRSIGFGVLAGFLSFLMMIAPGLQAQSGGQRDCSSNSMIRCGTLSAAELRQKYRSQPDARAAFAHMGISQEDMANSNWRRGHVTSDGKVVVDGKTVATNAMTAGRQNMAGSRAVTKNGSTFYVRPTSASFSQGQIDALVAMKNGRFQHAVLTSCGNPVKAKPVPKPAAKQKPQKKNQVVKKQVIQHQEQSQSQQVTINNQPPPTPTTPSPKEEVPPEPAPQPEQPETPAEVPVPVEQPAAVTPVESPAPAPVGKAELPDTGPGQALGVSALVAIGGTVWYALYAQLRSRFL